MKRLRCHWCHKYVRRAEVRDLIIDDPGAFHRVCYLEYRTAGKKPRVLVTTVTGVLLVCLTLLVSACMPKVVPVPVIQADSLPRQIWGTTVCDSSNQPLVLILKDLWGRREFEATLFHEMVHVTQVLNSGDCREFGRKYSASAKFRFRIEAEAYCRTLAAFANPEKFNEGFIRLLVYLYEAYGQEAGYTMDQTKERVTPYCQRGGKDADRDAKNSAVQLPESGFFPRSHRLP